MPLIAKAVAYAGADKALVDNFNRRSKKSGSIWNDDRFKSLRSTIKKHVSKEQGKICCYCLREIAKNGRAFDVEHVLPKSVFPQFLFEPKNLAASCTDCNEEKGSKPVLRRNNPGIKRYPNSNQFLLIHPHFDEYAEHISKVGSIYLPLSEKGVATIHIAGLLYRTLRAYQYGGLRGSQAQVNEITKKISGSSGRKKELHIYELTALVNARWA